MSHAWRNAFQHTCILETIWLVFIWYLCLVNLKVNVSHSRNCWKMRSCARVVYVCCGLLRACSIRALFESMQGNTRRPPETGIFKLPLLLTKKNKKIKYSGTTIFWACTMGILWWSNKFHDLSHSIYIYLINM